MCVLDNPFVLGFSIHYPTKTNQECMDNPPFVGLSRYLEPKFPPRCVSYPIDRSWVMKLHQSSYKTRSTRRQLLWLKVAPHKMAIFSILVQDVLAYFGKVR